MRTVINRCEIVSRFRARARDSLRTNAKLGRCQTRPLGFSFFFFFKKLSRRGMLFRKSVDPWVDS